MTDLDKLHVAFKEIGQPYRDFHDVYRRQRLVILQHYHGQTEFVFGEDGDFFSSNFKRHED